jgi:hypothetical protein
MPFRSNVRRLGPGKENAQKEIVMPKAVAHVMFVAAEPVTSTSKRTIASVIVMMVAGVVASGCAVSASDGSGQTESSDEALAVGNCQVYAYTPSASGKNGQGLIDCGNNDEQIELQVCLQQNISGTWQTIGFTCHTGGPGWGRFMWVTSNSVPFYTPGRGYRTWAWGYANGHAQTVVSNAING